MSALAFKTLGGEGEDIVLVHGFGSDRLSWLANTPSLMTVGRVHVLDLPGHGDSPVDAGDGSPRALAHQVSAVLRANGVTRFHMVGHSLGGGLAFLIAADQPQVTASITLIAPAGLGGGVDAAFLSTYPALTDSEETASLLRRLVINPILINKLTVQRVLAQLGRDGARDALTAIAAGLASHEFEMTAAALTIAGRELPRLVVWGERDTINPLDDERLRAFGGDRFIVPNAAHLPHIENPRLVNEALMAFLKRNMAG